MKKKSCSLKKEQLFDDWYYFLLIFIHFKYLKFSSTIFTMFCG